MISPKMIWKDIGEASPGPLPDTMSLEDLGAGRPDIRNRVLAPIFEDLGLIEAWGAGMQKIRQASLKYPEIETVFQEVGLAFQVQFKKRPQADEKLQSLRHQVGTKLAPSRDQAGTKEPQTQICHDPARGRIVGANQ
jgi:ATP-dependent DNA helicase RecG